MPAALSSLSSGLESLTHLTILVEYVCDTRISLLRLLCICTDQGEGDVRENKKIERRKGTARSCGVACYMHAWTHVRRRNGGCVVAINVYTCFECVSTSQYTYFADNLLTFQLPKPHAPDLLRNWLNARQESISMRIFFSSTGEHIHSIPFHSPHCLSICLSLSVRSVCPPTKAFPQQHGEKIANAMCQRQDAYTTSNIQTMVLQDIFNC